MSAADQTLCSVVLLVGVMATCAPLLVAEIVRACRQAARRPPCG